MNPGKDQLGDLVHRMRRLASEVFAARDIALERQAATETFRKGPPPGSQESEARTSR